MCEELALTNSGYPASTGRPVADEKPEAMVSPTDLLTTSSPLLTNARVQVDLLLDHKQRIEDLPEDDRKIKLCSDAGSMKTVTPGQYFVTLIEVELATFDGPIACREYTVPRDDESPRAKGWIRENTEIGPVLEVTTSYPESKSESIHYCVTVWVMICNGLNKNVTEMLERRQEIRDDTFGAGTGRPVANRNRHQYQCHLLEERRYQISNVNGRR